jgi:hypothetical protein
MRKVSICLLVLLLIAAAAPAIAHAADPGASEFCKANDDLPAIFDSHGDCVSTTQIVLSYGNASVVGFCKFLDHAGHINLGQCVSDLRTP